MRSMLRALAATLSLLLAAPAWAQEPVPEPEPTDVPRAVKSAVTTDDKAVGAGVWSSVPRSAATAKQISQCEADKKQLQDALEQKPIQPAETPGKIAAAASIAGAGGIIVGALIAVVGLIASGHVK